jgi:hypothetical protein
MRNRAILAYFLGTGCFGPEDQLVFQRAEVPDEAVFRWFESTTPTGGQRAKYSARVGTAFRSAITREEDAERVRSIVGRYLWNADPAAIEEAKLALQQQALGFALPPSPSGSDAVSVLSNAGFAMNFDVETGTFPNEHDALLQSLGGLNGSSITDVLFTEVEPDESDPNSVYELTAFFDGKALRTQAANFGDWYDLEAVIRLLNAVTAERGINQTYAVLATGDQTATVLVLNSNQLNALTADGSIELDTSDASRAAGKAFEDEVIKQLSNDSN